jgi:hypothetical protein
VALLGSDHLCGILKGMGRRFVGVAFALVVVGALGLALANGSRRPSYSSVEALGHDIYAHGIGCPRLYSYQAGGPRVGVDAATCLVGSDTITLYAYEDASVLKRLGEPSARSFVVGRNWLVVTMSRPAALQVALAIGGNLIPLRRQRPTGTSV